jgi:hypothetical protein
MTSDSVRNAWVTAMSPHQLAVLGDRVAVSWQHQVQVHRARLRERLQVGDQRLRALAAVQRAREEGVGRDVRQQVVGRHEHAPLAVVEHSVGGAVAGPERDGERAVAELDLLAVAQGARDRGPGPPGPEAARHGLERPHDLGRQPVAQHDRDRELVLGVGVVAVALQERHQAVDRRHVGPRPGPQDLDEADVVDVLVGHEDQLQVLDPVPERAQLALQLVERDAGVRTAVDERERLVLDQVDVDPPDRERRRDGEPVDPGRARGGERVGRAHRAISYLVNRATNTSGANHTT